MLAGFLDMVEVNASFYSIPTPSAAEGWLRKTAGNPGFRFVLKLWKGFTHDAAWTEQDSAAFRDVSRVLREAGCLTGILAQFPFYFKATDKGREQVAALCGLFAEYSLFFEFRDMQWLQPEEVQRVTSLGGKLCNIDLPGGEHGLNLTTAAPGGEAYLRLHGRNRDAWFSKQSTRDEKYDYLYSAEEMQLIAARIRALAAGTQRTTVVTNNHYKGKAAANAVQLKHLVTGARPAVPDTLAAAYPALKPFAESPGLFG